MLRFKQLFFVLCTAYGYSAHAEEVLLEPSINHVNIYRDFYGKIKEPPAPSGTLEQKIFGTVNSVGKTLTALQKKKKNILKTEAEKNAPQTDKQFLWTVGLQRDLPQKTKVDTNILTKEISKDFVQASATTLKDNIEIAKVFESGISFEFSFGNLFSFFEKENSPTQIVNNKHRFVRYGLVLAEIEPSDDADGKSFAALDELTVDQLSSARKSNLKWEIAEKSMLNEKSGLQQIDEELFLEGIEKENATWTALTAKMPSLAFKTRISPASPLEKELTNADDAKSKPKFGVSAALEQVDGYYTLKQTFQGDTSTVVHILRIPTGIAGQIERTYSEDWTPTNSSWTNILGSMYDPIGFDITYNHLKNTRAFSLTKSTGAHSTKLTVSLLPGVKESNYAHEFNKANYALNYAYAF
ncbi:MAG: hypothetical protein KBD78_01175 [Oligoflexales bacterium]|nr:hypothetical protein [Oligoflexales bacterium]